MAQFTTGLLVNRTNTTGRNLRAQPNKMSGKEKTKSKDGGKPAETGDNGAHTGSPKAPTTENTDPSSAGDTPKQDNNVEGGNNMSTEDSELSSLHWLNREII